MPSPGASTPRAREAPCSKTTPRGRAACAHHRFALPGNRDGGSVEAELVQAFDLHNVEGLASDPDGYFYYVTDEDEPSACATCGARCPAGVSRGMSRWSALVVAAQLPN